MSKSQQLPFDFRTFMKSIDSSFDGTFFTVNGKRYSISRQNNQLWNLIKQEHRTAVLIDPTIILDILFCIAYQVTHNTPDSQQLFGSDIKDAFPVPKNVQDYFKFRTVLQLDKKAESLTSQLQDLSSKITELEALLADSLVYRQELVADVVPLRSDLAEFESKFHEEDQRVKALTNLMNATREVKSLLGEDLAVLQSDFSSVLQDCKKKLIFYSDQMRYLKAHISDKEKMLSEQCAAIATIETNLRKQVVEQDETESTLRSMQKEIFQEMSKFGQDDLPHQLLKYVEESRLFSEQATSRISLGEAFQEDC